VNGQPLHEIAATYFQSADSDLTTALTKACKAIYRTLVNSGPWGVSALSKMPTSGLDFDTLPADAKQRINALPSMIYHGVRREAAVLMRMNSVPRSVAEALGAKFQSASAQEQLNVKSAREYLKSLNIPVWADARPEGVAMSGEDYRKVWQQLTTASLPRPVAISFLSPASQAGQSSRIAGPTRFLIFRYGKSKIVNLDRPGSQRFPDRRISPSRS